MPQSGDEQVNHAAGVVVGVRGTDAEAAHATHQLLGLATKAATESIHESLAAEIRPFGLKVTLVEPGAYATEFGASRKEAAPLEAYAELRTQMMASIRNVKRGDPQTTAQAILQLVDAPEPPLRLILGSETLPIARAAYAERLATWEAWETVSNAAQGKTGIPAWNTVS